MSPPSPSICEGDRILVTWLGDLEPAIVRKLHRSGKVQVLWPQGTVSSVERHDVYQRGDTVLVRWLNKFQPAVLRKLHRCGKVQVLWNEGTVSSVGHDEVQALSGILARKRKTDTCIAPGTKAARTNLGRPFKKDRHVINLENPLGFAPPICWSLVGPQDWRGVMFLPKFLTVPEIKVVTELACADMVLGPVLDRDDELQFNHTAYRIDQAFGSNLAVFNKFVGAMRFADSMIWNALGGPGDCVYPEVEFIRYEGSARSGGGRRYAIEPHVDNHSAVTIVCLLSRTKDFQGGVLGCQAVERDDVSRLLTLAQGDAVVFQGEKLLHWVTPVTSGVREVLQVELSRI